jgi:hypothetical protein
MFASLFQIRLQHAFDPFHECADSARQIAPMCYDEGHSERPAMRDRVAPRPRTVRRCRCGVGACARSVEVIVGRTVPKTDQSLTRTKSPRILHLEVTYEGATTCVELTATAKQLIHKSRLAAYS